MLFLDGTHYPILPCVLFIIKKDKNLQLLSWKESKGFFLSKEIFFKWLVLYLFCSRASKGFSSNQTMKQCGCIEAFTETLQVFLQALSVPVHKALLHSGVLQFLHRMVVCLEEEILPFIPLALQHLLKSADTRELYDFIPLINQVVSKFKVMKIFHKIMSI